GRQSDCERPGTRGVSGIAAFRAQGSLIMVKSFKEEPLADRPKYWRPVCRCEARRISIRGTGNRLDYGRCGDGGDQRLADSVKGPCAQRTPDRGGAGA